MLVQATLTGEVAKLEFDDSLSNIIVWASLAFLAAVVGLSFRSLQGFFGALMLIVPVVAAIWLVRGPSPPRRILRIGRRALLITGTKNGKVRRQEVRSFHGVVIQHIRVPRTGTLHQVRVLTSDGPLLIAAFPSRALADEIAGKLATWLNVKVVDGGRSGVFAATHDIQIWR